MENIKDILTALIPAISQIDRGCDSCISDFIENANYSIAINGFAYEKQDKVIKVIEVIEVVQEWEETSENKTGWEADGWKIESTNDYIDECLEVAITDYDKFYNLIKGFILKSAYEILKDEKKAI